MGLTYFTHSDNQRWTANGYVPKSWLTVPEAWDIKTRGEFIFHWYHVNDWVHDTDNCGSHTRLFFFEGGTVGYRVSHSWWIDDVPEWNVLNDIEIEMIPVEQLPSWMQKRRDWI